MVEALLMLFLIVSFVVGLLTGRAWAWGIMLLAVIAFFFKPLLWVLLGLAVFGLFMAGMAALERALDRRSGNERPTDRLPNVNDLPDYRDSNAYTAESERRTEGVRFYRPVRHFRYTRHARKMAAVNTLARAMAPKKAPKPKVGQTKEVDGKTYRFSESRRWVRVK